MDAVEGKIAIKIGVRIWKIGTIWRKIIIQFATYSWETEMKKIPYQITYFVVL